jgi:hypothetical protein
MRPPDRGDIVEWITECWSNLSDQIIISGFSKCGFRSPAGLELRVEDDQYDTTALIAELAGTGYIEETVREVQDCIDVPVEITEVVL